MSMANDDFIAQQLKWAAEIADTPKPRRGDWVRDWSGTLFVWDMRHQVRFENFPSTARYVSEIRRRDGFVWRREASPTAPTSPPERCEGRYPVPQSPPRDEQFSVTYRCALPSGHAGPHGAEPASPSAEMPVIEVGDIVKHTDPDFAHDCLTWLRHKDDFRHVSRSELITAIYRTPLWRRPSETP